MKRKSGFTLIELVITIAIAAILLVVGVPAMYEFIQNNRVAAETNELVTAMNLARSEALRRQAPVAVCPSDNAWDTAACSNAEDDWDKGWLVYRADPANLANFIGSAEVSVIRTFVGTTEDDDDGATKIQPDALDRQRVIFNGDGRLNMASVGTPGECLDTLCFQISIADATECRGDTRADQRIIEIGNTGRITSYAPPCD